MWFWLKSQVRLSQQPSSEGLAGHHIFFDSFHQMGSSTSCKSNPQEGWNHHWSELLQGYTTIQPEWVAWTEDIIPVQTTLRTKGEVLQHAREICILNTYIISKYSLRVSKPFHHIKNFRVKLANLPIDNYCGWKKKKRKTSVTTTCTNPPKA